MNWPRLYGGSVMIQSTLLSGSCFITFRQSPNNNCEVLTSIWFFLGTLQSTSIKHQDGIISVSYIDYIQKSGCLTSACLLFEAFHSLCGKQNRVNTHVEVYKTPVKCASEDMVSPRSTLRRVYTTPRGVTSALFSTAYSIVEVSNSQKQSVSNAFQYVVLRPSAPSFSNDIAAALGR